MLFRRYGKRVDSVVTHFDPYALNEIGFRRDRSRTLPADEFAARYAKVAEYAVEEETEGPVQSEAETEILARLERQVRTRTEGLAPGQVLLVENEQGTDYPKLRNRQDRVVVRGENRMYFRWRVHPPIRLGLYEPREGKGGRAGPTAGSPAVSPVRSPEGISAPGRRP